MIFALTLLYLTTWLMQPGEWIAAIAFVPFLEIELLLFTLLAIFGKLERFSRVARHPSTLLFLLYIVLAMLSVLEERQGFYIAVMEVGYIHIQYFCVYLLIATALDSGRKLYLTLCTMLWSGILISFFCLRLYYTGEGLGNGIGLGGHHLNWRGATQWIGLFQGSNTTALILVTLSSIGLALIFAARSPSARILGLLGYLLIGFAFYHTHSRGGTIGFAMALATIVYLRTRISLKLFIPMAVIAMVLFLVLKPTEEGRGLGESTTGERVGLMYQGLQMVKSEPFLGVGIDQFKENNSYRKEAHNLYLQRVAETGVVGGFFFFMMFVAAAKAAFSIWSASRGKHEEDEANALCLLTSMAGFGASAFFLSVNIETPFIILGLFTALSINQEYERIIGKKDLYLTAAVLIGGIAAVYTAVNLYNLLF